MKKLVIAGMAALMACVVFGATDVVTDSADLRNVVRRAGTGTTLAVTNDRLQEVWIPIALLQDAGGSADTRTTLTNAISFISVDAPAVSFNVGTLTSVVGSEAVTALTSYPAMVYGDVLSMTFTSTNANISVLMSKQVIPR